MLLWLPCVLDRWVQILGMPCWASLTSLAYRAPQVAASRYKQGHCTCTQASCLHSARGAQASLCGLCASIRLPQHRPDQNPQFWEQAVCWCAKPAWPNPVTCPCIPCPVLSLNKWFLCNAANKPHSFAQVYMGTIGGKRVFGVRMSVSSDPAIALPPWITFLLGGTDYLGAGFGSATFVFLVVRCTENSAAGPLGVRCLVLVAC